MQWNVWLIFAAFFGTLTAIIAVGAVAALWPRLETEVAWRERYNLGLIRIDELQQQLKLSQKLNEARHVDSFFKQATWRCGNLGPRDIIPKGGCSDWGQ